METATGCNVAYMSLPQPPSQMQRVTWTATRAGKNTFMRNIINTFKSPSWGYGNRVIGTFCCEIRENEFGSLRGAVDQPHAIEVVRVSIRIAWRDDSSTSILIYTSARCVYKEESMISKASWLSLVVWFPVHVTDFFFREDFFLASVRTVFFVYLRSALLPNTYLNSTEVVV